MKKSLMGLVCFAALSASTMSAMATAVTPTPESAAARKHLSLVIIEEGTALSVGYMDATSRSDKYAALAKSLSGKGGADREVRVVMVHSLSAAEEGIKSGAYDFILGRGAEFSALAVRDHEYRPIAQGKGNGGAIFIAKNADIKNLSDIKGRVVSVSGTPEEATYMSKLAIVLLNETKLAQDTQLSYQKRQDLVGFTVTTGMVDVGVVMSYSRVGREWEKNGGKILYRGSDLPFQPLIAAKWVSAADAERVLDRVLRAGATKEGLSILEGADLLPFEALASPKPLLELLTYLEGGAAPTLTASAAPAVTAVALAK